jgi:sialidase-1
MKRQNPTSDLAAGLLPVTRAAKFACIAVAMAAVLSGGGLFADENAEAEDESGASELVLGDGFTWFNSNRRWLTTPIHRLDDGRLVTLVDNGVVFSPDEMATWQDRLQILGDAARAAHPGSVPGGNGTLHVASTGEWHVAWRDPRRPSSLDDYWDKALDGPAEGATADVWVTTSTDEGHTWSTPQKVFSGPGGYPPKRILETRSGALIMPVQYHTSAPGRNVISGVRSTDRGKTWTKFGNEIDVDGRGHHDGGLEPALVELADGRVWMVFRTGKGHLWQSFSEDDGATWSTPESTGISASSSPPYLDRLSDGRLMLLWNRGAPTDGGTYRRRGGDGYFSEAIVSWNRKELSLATSRDDGKTWGREVIVATHPRNGRVSYPYFFEDGSGQVKIFASQGKLEVSIPVASLP